MIKVDILSISFCKKEIIFLYLQHRQGKLYGAQNETYIED